MCINTRQLRILMDGYCNTSNIKHAQHEQEEMFKMNRFTKVTSAIAFTLLLVIAGVFHPPTQVFANTTASNAHLTINLNASRPLIGNPRGFTTVTTRTTSSTGIRIRTTVRNSNGTVSSAPVNRNGVGADGWSTRLLASSTFASGICPNIERVTVTGTTRSGTVRGYVARRSTDSRTGVVSWNHQLSISREW